MTRVEGHTRMRRRFDPRQATSSPVYLVPPSPPANSQ
jgi:hypothetical protein